MARLRTRLRHEPGPPTTAWAVIADAAGRELQLQLPWQDIPVGRRGLSLTPRAKLLGSRPGGGRLRQPRGSGGGLGSPGARVVERPEHCQMSVIGDWASHSAQVCRARLARRLRRESRPAPSDVFAVKLATPQRRESKCRRSRGVERCFCYGTHFSWARSIPVAAAPAAVSNLSVGRRQHVRGTTYEYQRVKYSRSGTPVPTKGHHPAAVGAKLPFKVHL